MWREFCLIVDVDVIEGFFARDEDWVGNGNVWNYLRILTNTAISKST